MEKLMIILLVFVLIACGSAKEKQNEECQSFQEIALTEAHKYLKLLDTIEFNKPKIIEFRIHEKDGYFIGDMFLSGPYVRGQKLPKFYKKINNSSEEVHLLIYCDNNNLSKEDSLGILNRLTQKDLIVENALEWILSGEWSTQDYERIKLIFCKDEIYNYKLNTRIQEVEENLVYPECK